MAAEPHNSIWAQSAPTRQPAEKLRHKVSTEVAVIGGGLSGLSAALHLARAGRSVTLVEGRTIGWGGSGRNNGQVIPTLAAMEPAAMQARYGEEAEPFIKLVRDSANDLFKLVAQHGLQCDAEQSGWFQPAHSVDYLRLSEARVNAWQKHDSPAELLDKPACDALLGSPHWHGGMLNPQGGHINPLKLVQELARVCAESGVHIYENSTATKITRVKDQWQISTEHGQVLADTLLLATNAYSGGLAPEIDKSFVPVTAWQLATPPLNAAQRAAIIPARQAVSDTRGDLWYFRYTADHRLVTGAALLLKTNARSRLQLHAAKRLQTAFPQLGKVSFSHVWNGFVGITADFTPRFHELGPNYYSFTGYNGRGLALSLAVGREFARKINGKTCALPFEAPRPIPLHGLVRHVARSRLILTRLKDKQPPKV